MDQTDPPGPAGPAAEYAVQLADRVTLSRLPFGGAVLVNGATLALAECGEREAGVIEGLLRHGVPGPDTSPSGQAVRRMAEDLLSAGWFVAGPAPDRR